MTPRGTTAARRSPVPHRQPRPFKGSQRQSPASERIAAVAEHVVADVDAIMQGLALRQVRRYSWQRFWEVESLLSEVARVVSVRRGLENVAEHSWHVADVVLLLGGRFEGVDPFRSCALATLHDKLELITGDLSPIGRDGTAAGTHFGDVARKAAKNRAEADALVEYLRVLSPASRPLARELFTELASGESADARFVKAVDKVQALAYVVHAKRRMPAKHRLFTVAYSEQACTYFPPLTTHVRELQSRLH